MGEQGYDLSAKEMLTLLMLAEIGLAWVSDSDPRTTEEYKQNSRVHYATRGVMEFARKRFTYDTPEVHVNRHELQNHLTVLIWAAKEELEGVGGCDHSVGICCCGIIDSIMQGEHMLMHAKNQKHIHCEQCQSIVEGGKNFESWLEDRLCPTCRQEKIDTEWEKAHANEF